MSQSKNENFYKETLSAESRALMAEEEAYLAEVLDFIEKRTAYLAEAGERSEEEMRRLKAEAWEEHLELKGESSVGQIDSALVQDELARTFRAGQDYREEYRFLKRMKKKPYFGHICFHFDDEPEGQNDDIYIGLKDIIDLDNFRQYVTDWRAPLASVYYNVSERGPASYKNQDTVIKGELLEKYQVSIENGQVLRVIDSMEQIYDDILQLVLGGHASARMKQIAQTLQREQSKIIRSELNRNLLIQGVAGSGKTSIALHRAAYMMYIDKSIKADNILLVTPSESFAAYVSQVLPSLEEDNVPSLTVEQILRYDLADLEGRYERFGFLPAKHEKIEALAAYEWLGYAEEFTDFVEREVFSPKDIVTPSLTVPAALLERLYRQNYRFLPPFKRHGAMLRHLRGLIPNEQDYQAALELLDRGLSDMFVIRDIREAFETFVRFVIREKGVSKTLFRPENLDTADLELMALLKVMLYGPADNSWVRHLIVDEMQDLSFIAHECLRRIFPCPRTILGDINQAVRFRTGEDYLEKLAALYRRDKLKLEEHQLLTSYRSTREITEFSRGILQDESIRPLDRRGEPVKQKLFAEGGTEQRLEAAYEQLKAWRDEGFRTAAAIAADEEEAALFRAYLAARNEEAGEKEALTFNNYLREEEGFAVTVCDVAGAKGVEFDAVLLLDCSAAKFGRAIDRTLAYVAATRALHRLTILAEGAFSPFLPA